MFMVALCKYKRRCANSTAIMMHCDPEYTKMCAEPIRERLYTCVYKRVVTQDYLLFFYVKSFMFDQ